MTYPDPDDARRVCWIAQHAERYREAARREFREYVRDACWRFVDEFITSLLRAWKRHGRAGW